MYPIGVCVTIPMPPQPTHRYRIERARRVVSLAAAAAVVFQFSHVRAPINNARTAASPEEWFMYPFREH